MERPEWDKLDDDITRNTETLKDVSPVYVIGGAHAICTNCKKDFYKTPQWAYKLGSKYFCSYKCSREYKSGLKKKTNKLLDGKGAIK